MSDRETAAMDFGRRAEVMIAPWFTERTGLPVRGAQTWCEHPNNPWMRCTVDGFVYDNDGNLLGVLEIKTTSDTAAEWAKEIPVQYRCQAVWQMAVNDCERVWFAVLHLAYGRPDFQVYDFHRDPAEEAFVVGECSRFWHEHVLTGVPPATDGHSATAIAIADRWPTATLEMIECDEPTATTVALLAARKDQLKTLKAKVEELENKVKATIGTAEALTYEGRTIATWSEQERAGFDHKRALADHPELAEYATLSTHRVLRIKPAKDAQ